MASPLAPTEGSSASREATPVSTASSSRPADPLSATASTDVDASDSAVGITPAPGVGANEQDDVDRFLKRMEMEKKVMQLQQRLELASVKANNGWSDMSIGEIENRLPPSPRAPVSPTVSRYDLPSPSRSLHDPTPAASSSHHRFHYGPPTTAYAPSSPRKRRMEEHLDGFPQTMTRGSHQHQHRRASSSATLASLLAADQRPQAQPAYHTDSTNPRDGAHQTSTAYHPGSPLRPRDSKKRSQSHSHRDRPSTQDVDAAKALTFMLGSGSGSGGSSDWEKERGGWESDTRGRETVERECHPAPPLTSTSSLPLPHLSRHKGPNTGLSPGKSAIASRHTTSAVPSSQIGAISSSTIKSTAGMEGRGEDDKAAVELMMFLAHSPSPAAPKESQMRSVGSTARVLFADDPKPSNLSAPPITAVQIKEDVGGLLGGA